MESGDKQSDNTSNRKVIASAIDSNCLILEDPTTGQKISWPLDKIPSPLNLGNELDLILQCADSSDSFNRPSNSASEPSKEDLMRKMLEKLVN